MRNCQVKDKSTIEPEENEKSKWLNLKLHKDKIWKFEGSEREKTEKKNSRRLFKRKRQE